MTTFGFYDLIEAFGQGGCPVCRLLKRDVAKQLDSILYEFVLDQKIQRHFRDSKGLCSEHGHLLTQQGNALGIASLYFAVLYDLDESLGSTAAGEGGGRSRLRSYRGRGGAALANALEPTRPCMTCQMRDESEARYLTILAEGIHDPRLIAAYDGSDGLCLPHFRGLLRALPNAETVTRVTRIQAGIWTRLKEELEEFMRKSDFHNKDERIGAEGDSWRRAVERISGEGGAFSSRG